MPEAAEARIVVTRQRDGRATIQLYAPSNGQVVETRMKAGPSPDDVATKVAQVKALLESKGLRVTFCERSS